MRPCFKKILASLAVVSLCLGLQQCFVLRRYIYTDKELEEHYQNSPVKPTYKFLSLAGRRVHYASVAKSDTLPLLVLVHGAPGAWYGYMNLMDDSVLQRHFKIIAPDRPGYGKSGYGKAELSTQMQALAIKEIIDRENLSGKKVTLLGRSYGAPIAAWYAIHYPQNTRQLVMVSPVIDPDREKFFWFSPIGKWRPVQWLLPDLMNVATREKYAHPVEMRQLEPQWKNLFVPTWVLSGEKDWVADTANFTFARKKLINCEANCQMLQNTGHLVTFEKADLVKQILLLE